MKAAIYQNQKFKAPKNAKKAFFVLSDPPKLVSRKIRVAEKSWNFHTVHTVEITEIYSHWNNISSNHLLLAGSAGQQCTLAQNGKIC